MVESSENFRAENLKILLKAALKKAGNQSLLAKATGIHRRTIGRYKTGGGKNPPDRERLRKLSTFLSIDEINLDLAPHQFRTKLSLYFIADLDFPTRELATLLPNLTDRTLDDYLEGEYIGYNLSPRKTIDGTEMIVVCYCTIIAPKDHSSHLQFVERYVISTLNGPKDLMAFGIVSTTSQRIFFIGSYPPDHRLDPFFMILAVGAKRGPKAEIMHGVLLAVEGNDPNEIVATRVSYYRKGSRDNRKMGIYKSSEIDESISGPLRQAITTRWKGEFAV